jgi:DNA-binding IclR family transcriptional regulator
MAEYTESKSGQGEPSIQSVDRAIQILRCFLGDSQLTLTEICNAVGLHKSTGFNIISTLKNNGLLDKDEESGKYRLGTELYRLAASANQNIRSISVPHIRQICAETGETVELVIPDDTHITYIEMQESSQWLKIGSAVGKRIPMYCAAAGKAILANMPSEQASSILDRSKLEPLTPTTRISKDALMEEFKEIRQLGYAVNMGELDNGLIAVAAVIVNRRGDPVGSISCSIPTVRCSDKRIEQIGQLLKKHTDDISVCMLQ